MPDPKVRALAQSNDIVGLFRYLGPMWLKVCMENLEDLTTFLKIGFTPTPTGYLAEMQAAGIDVGRMQVAMAAVLHKSAQSLTWGKFEETYAEKLAKLPLTQRSEVRAFWFAGPKPGLSGAGSNPPPMIGNTGDWFVTDFSGSSFSVVITVGFTAIQGSITFKRADGTTYSNAIGVVGPSIGASWTPGAGTASALAAKFPILNKLVNPGTIGEGIMNWLTKSPSAVAKVLWQSPVFSKLLTSASDGPGSWKSYSIGLVTSSNGRTLEIGDFAGSCVIFSASGTAAVINGGVYALAFGLPKAWNPLSDPTLSHAKGFALISAGSASVQIPGAGVSETLFWGEIV